MQKTKKIKDFRGFENEVFKQSKIFEDLKAMLSNNKKAMADIGTALWHQWAEIFFIILILIGFVISISIKNAFLNYLVIFCAGLMGGRTIYKRKGKQPLFPFFLIIIGFLLGYMLSGILKGINTKLIIILFIIGSIASYYIHKKEYIKM
jgi:hypothetical protein